MRTSLAGVDYIKKTNYKQTVAFILNVTRLDGDNKWCGEMDEAVGICSKASKMQRGLGPPPDVTRSERNNSCVPKMSILQVVVE